MEKVSLLYPQAKISEKKHLPKCLSENDAEELRIYDLINLTNADINTFLTDDKDIIEYRQKTVNDLLNNPGAVTALEGMLPYLCDITELRFMSSSQNGCDNDYLYSISEIEIYVSLMDYLNKNLLPLKSNFTSESLIDFSSVIEELTLSDYHKELTCHLEKLASRVRDIKSITVGINLDEKMSVESAGVVSVNSDKFKSGDFFEKVKRLEFKNNDMTLLSKLIPYYKSQSDNQKIALSNAMNNAITDVFKSSVKSWKESVQGYIFENTDFLIEMIPEVEFLIKSVKFLLELKERGCNLYNPVITNDNTIHAKGIINPIVALKTNEKLVTNDIDFDENGMIYVITGPNRGGKSVMCCAVGILVTMAQAGLPVPAESFSLSPVDKILTHFPAGNENTVEKGRLGEECSRLSTIFEEITEKSLVLLDESLSSTGSYEGSYIASEVLSGLSMAKCRCIFSTHLHDLAASVEKLNNEFVPMGGVKIDNMVAEIADGERTYKILRKTPDGKSYAKDIAEKYGLSFDKIMRKMNNNL